MSLAQQFLSKINESTEGTDSIKIEVVTLIRVLEFARENIKSDNDLHKLVEQLVEASKLAGESVVDMTYVEQLLK